MIVIVIPLLGRPHRIAPLIASIRDNTTVSHRVIFITSPNDPDVHAVLREHSLTNITASHLPGPADYAKKINLGYRSTSEPFIFTGADDLAFHPGWDIEALKLMDDPNIGVVGTQDLCNQRVLKGLHSTHSLIRRHYADTHGTIDGPGAIYAECYPHEFVDDELIETAQSRNAFAFAHASVVEHLHPNCGKAPKDALYRQSTARLQRGRQIFRQRRPRWNPNANVRTLPISIIVGTYGDQSWVDLAQKRAIPSAQSQKVFKAAEVIHHHGANLAEARNAGALQATSDWLLFLDADDELANNFLQGVSRYLNTPKAVLLNPAVQFIVDGKPRSRKLFATRDLRQGNYLVIGTLIRRDVFFKTGGFDPKYPHWEDWAMFWRASTFGRIVRVPQAVYKAHWSQTGRNNTVADPEGLRMQIQQDFDVWQAQQ